MQPPSASRSSSAAARSAGGVAPNLASARVAAGGVGDRGLSAVLGIQEKLQRRQSCIRWRDGGHPKSQRHGRTSTQAPHGSRRTRSQRRAVDRARASLGRLRVLRSGRQAIRARLRAGDLSRRALHARQHRARLPHLQQQQVQRRSHGMAAAKAARRARASCCVTSRSGQRSPDNSSCRRRDAEGTGDLHPLTSGIRASRQR